MLQHISEEDLIFFETISHPKACAEILFGDFDNLGSFSETEFGEIRKYQVPFLSFDTMYYQDKRLSSKENFNIKKGLAESFALGGRLTGKSLIHLILDVLISIFLGTFKWGTVSSSDLNHVRGVMNKILIALKIHPIFKQLKPQITKSPSYNIYTENGCLLESVNNNLSGKNPGGNWYGKHCDKNWEEESSFLTDAVTNKKKMAEAEIGCIYRLSGMTTFSKMSPMGRLFYDIKNKKKIVNMPSYVNPTYTEQRDNDAIQEFGGKQSHGYQVQIMGKVVENCDTVYDIEEIRKTYKYDKKDNPILIKNFEITKDNFGKYKDRIIIEKPEGVEQAAIALDKGEGAAPTEIIIIFNLGKKFRYEYNITLYKLKPDEDEEIINYIINLVKPTLIGIDSTSDKTLLCSLSKLYGENVIGVNFNENIEVGYKKNGDKIEHDDNGKPIMLKEDMVHFSIQCLKDIFYKGKIECLTDYKLDQQFDGVISSTTNKGKVIYGYKTENHLHQAFQVFAIANWLTEKKQLKPTGNRKPGMGVVG
jgi:hypothetical protein